MILKRIQKSKSLRIVNLLGLSVIFACLLLSFAYIKKELSYDRFNTNADRIVRFSIQYNDEIIDGRNYGFNKNSAFMTDIPGVEDGVYMEKVNTGVVSMQGKNHIMNDLYFISSNFFDVFSYKLLEGDKGTVLDAPGKAAISRKLARQLFGDQSPIGKEILLFGRRIPEQTIFINGVFEDFPETSHFYTDLIVHRPDNSDGDWAYIYLLMNEHTDVYALQQAFDNKYKEFNIAENFRKLSAYLMPLTDIHLHSHVQRELEANGNIYYVYLVAGANVLLLLIVLFNLWLNTGLIFSYNRRYYQLLRLNGAPASVIVKDESLLAIILGCISILLGGMITYLFEQNLPLSILTHVEIISLSLSFLLVVYIISLMPVLTKLSTIAFRNTDSDLRLSNFTLSNIKYMLIAQYAMVMFIVIVGFGISKQIHLIKVSQVGGKENNILVMNEQSNSIKERYDIFRNELLKYPEIESVTAAMQLPGSAIRDRMMFRKEGDREEDGISMPILVVGEDFLPFFRITPIAGDSFKQSKLTYDGEMDMIMKYFSDNPVASNLSEEYVINRKAMQMFGFNSPEEAIGKHLYTSASGSISYINNGTIVGVTDDFIYTTTYEETIPQVILQRKAFLNCIMIRLNPASIQQGTAIFNQVWNQLFPDYPADYTFLQNIYSHVYHNELNAETIVRLFSLLSLVVANLGLIIIMAFVIKRKTKEIGIRKVNGATPSDIIKMLNSKFIVWVGVAFIIALPIAWYVMVSWLENFAHKTPLSWWIFAAAGVSVFFVSAVSISWQSWHAANLNPIKSLKTE
ncbi:MAG: ABC transporter permease [Tannerellaceae bacterium]|jgi:putative ABC transport system permease protein|nr:ABC transporter permease [Tannerellaceae bacterium]